MAWQGTKDPAELETYEHNASRGALSLNFKLDRQDLRFILGYEPLELYRHNPISSGLNLLPISRKLLSSCDPGAGKFIRCRRRRPV